MATADLEIPPLERGDRLSRAEFLHRWTAMPNLKRAELIQGIVYMPSPLSLEHGEFERMLSGWLWVYQVATPVCKGGNNCTWFMGDDDVPQPDLDLRLLQEYGGQSRYEGKYVAGAPEFLAEICVSSKSYDLNQKRDLYHASGVKEFLAVLVREQEVRWFRWTAEGFEAMPADPDGIHRSRVFPGLWLDSVALLADDGPRLMAVLDQGLKSPEHAAYLSKFPIV
jgi:Putative restriction endonuclease